ncbi:MAG TPA: transglutaminase domain-containing protein, partial [Dehalococcoidia bacterium]|nr:transglutaminase domain-containing protein [Dehalococcoidia bacterium]
MSQANWIEWFRDQPADVERPKPLWERLPPWATNWESWLTFAVVMLTFLSVARSIDSAHWVEGMPSLVMISFLALLTGFGLSKIKINELFLHLLAILTGVPVVVGFALSFMGETSLGPGLSHFWHRFGDWIDVIRTGGITTDNMPFVTIVLALTWIAAYLSAWAIFRWRNAWLALIPGGMGLLTNISYLPGQFSADFVVFLFGGMLLVMRVNLLNRVRDWQRRGIAVPQFLSLTLLNITVWIGIALLIVAWWVPLAGESRIFASAWNSLTSPLDNASADWSRLFNSIDAKREVPLHSLGATLPLQGKVTLSDRVVAEVDFGDQSNQGRNLVATRYDVYTPAGWKRGASEAGTIGPNGVSTADAPPVDKDVYKDRKAVPADVIVDTPNGVLLSIGQPLQASIDGRADVVNIGTVADVRAIHPKKDLKRGDQYTTVGSISVAPEEKLRAATTEYPDYIKQRYLQLPAELPQEVRDLAVNQSAAANNPYDKARAIEDYLRKFPNTYDIPIVPPGRDAVDVFLFDTKKGYSDYQATAMVVLLRAVGVPARLATGYSVQEFDLNTHRYIVREKDAESWPEVYFPEYGWVEFSPFAGAPLVSRPFTGSDNGSQADESPDIKFGAPIFAGPFGPEDIPGEGELGGAFKVHHPFNWLPVYLGLTLLAVLLICGGILRLAWEWGLRGLDAPVKTWEKTLRLARWTRLRPKANQTPNEFAGELTRRTSLEAEPRVVAESFARTR